MNKLFLIFFVVCNISYAKYNFPFKNPYRATIFGSGHMMTPNVPKNIPVVNKKLETHKDIPLQFWYSDGFKYSVVDQKKHAPLIFLLAGTGASFKSIRNKLFERIFYQNGYHIIALPSVTNENFLLNASTTRMPGVIYDDTKDLYAIMQKIYQKENLDVSDIYVVGYSLGATETAMLGEIDSHNKFFKFKRIFMVNPAVDAMASAYKLDNFIKSQPKNRARKIATLIHNILEIVQTQGLTEISVDEIFKIFYHYPMKDIEMKELIGAAFRLASIDLNYIADIVNKRNVYNKPSNSRYRPIFQDFENVNFASFEDYVNKVAMPYFTQKYHMNKDEIFKKATLYYVDDYLRNAKNVMVVTNSDELILTPENMQYLKDTLGKRVRFYEYGGHCGNMFYYENVAFMLKYLKTGEINYEN